MKITRVKITQKVGEGKSRVKGIASVLLDDSFVIHDIGIIERDNGLFIAMPSRKLKNGRYRNIVHPINQETRDMLEKEIIDVYNSMEESYE